MVICPNDHSLVENPEPLNLTTLAQIPMALWKPGYGRGSLQRGGHALAGGVGGQLVAVLRQVVLASMSLTLLLRFTVAREISSGIITARPIASERSRTPRPT